VLSRTRSDLILVIILVRTVETEPSRSKTKIVATKESIPPASRLATHPRRRPSPTKKYLIIHELVVIGDGGSRAGRVEKLAVLAA
jgi:hypothetical protein